MQQLYNEQNKQNEPLTLNKDNVQEKVNVYHKPSTKPQDAQENLKLPDNMRKLHMMQKIKFRDNQVNIHELILVVL